MAAKQRNTGTWVLFDVLYADGSRRSNRKVPAELLGGLDGDEPARKLIESQDEEIAKASGQPRQPIAALTRTPLPKPEPRPGAAKHGKAR
ncbi:hypothetical protein [Roseomonas marmotae]|uniref:ATP-dependent DNA ligase n=1 Tax=Roseomonas marmotae TaxID=2768161 RepID=A0ABS3KDX5_9PROT|nr:hypothetical protein [Roseomonas marmotae]MBO1075640.1 hypothetical protein [Roseomonas marmotae]QTI79501.1 hypothetical protein IAI58_01350 [Roseomonas marmotae]